ncbi:MAG: FecR domain-containing protein [Paracoccaceae bacterium]
MKFRQILRRVWDELLRRCPEPPIRRRKVSSAKGGGTMRLFRLLGAISLLLLPVSAPAKEVGGVVALQRGAWITGAEGRSRLAPDMRISMKDVIETDGAGSAQLLFDDGTKIAIGPRSKLVIDEVLMRSSTRASRFAVSAVSGSMRFITGKSPKSAYSISTPTATMGIRGTAFDVALRRNRRTDLVLFSGAVDFCSNEGCVRVTNACQTVTATSFGKITQTEGDFQKGRLLAGRFPLIVKQGKLQVAFHQPLERCGDGVGRVLDRASQSAPADRNDRPVAAPTPPSPPI